MDVFETREHHTRNAYYNLKKVIQVEMKVDIAVSGSHKTNCLWYN